MFKKKAFPAEKTLQMLRFTQHDNVLRLPSFIKPQHDTLLSFCAGVALLCSPHVIRRGRSVALHTALSF